MLSVEFHKSFASFIILTSEVGLRGLRLEREISLDAINALIKEPDSRPSWYAKEPFCPSFFLEKEGEQSYLVTTKAKFSLFGTCSRCLDEVEYKFTFDFKTRMLAKEKLAKKSDDDFSEDFFWTGDNFVHTEDSELAVSYFSDQSIDLGLVLREQLFLDLPDFPVCNSDFGVNNNSCRIDFIDISDTKPKLQNPFVKFFNKQR